MRHRLLAAYLFIIIGSLLGLNQSMAMAKETDQDMSLAPVGGAAMVDAFTGSLSATIPIEVPPGRHGMQPNLALAYWSGGGNGWVGMGWKLEVGAIERQARFGLNYSADDYMFRMSGNSGDLVNIGTGEYRQKVEGGFSRIRKLTATDGQPYWEITEKNGTRYFFGQTAASRMADPADASKIFKWCLDRVEDTNGNYMTVTYWGDQGQGYLDHIDYTGNSITGALPTNTIKFYSEARTDVADMYTTNYRVRMAYRAKTIETLANGQRSGAYKLVYTMGAATNRSLLSAVQQYGKDATLDASGSVSGGTAFPAISLAAVSSMSSFTDGTVWRNSWCGVSPPAGSIPSAWTPFGTGDFNGDGKTDIWCHDPIGMNTWVSLSTGTTFTDGNVWRSNWCGTSPPAGSISAAYTPFGTGDFNGDGKTDIWCHDPVSATTYVALSTGATFVDGTVWRNSWCGVSPPAGDVPSAWTPFGIGDFNGDGKTDIWCHDPVSATTYVALSTSATFVDGTVWRNSGWCGVSPPAGSVPSGWTPFDTGDFNGDGKTDIWCHDPVSATTYVALSTGATFVDGTVWRNSWCGVSPPAGDVPSAWTPFGIGDFNGDGKTDVWCHDPVSATTYVSRAGATLDTMDTLTSIANPSGGSVTWSYAPSTQYANTQLPFPVQTISSLTGNDGNGNSTTTNYTYSGGFHHIGERDFRGFNYSKVTGPVGPNGEQAISETWFHQGNDTAVDVNNPNVPTGYLKGKPYHARVIDGVGQFLTESATSYAADADGIAPFFNPPQQVDSSICHGTTCGSKTTRVIYTYDDYGNVTREDQYGDLADASDDRTVVRTYAPNTTAWLVGFPTSETMYQGIGLTNQVAASSLYYDGVTDCSVASTNQTPTKGNLTRTVRWLNGGLSPETRMAYDSLGNRTCTRDANGNMSTVTYDASGTFPKTVTNALGHQATTQYYGVDGVLTDKGLYGQIKTVIDPNGAIVTTEYDALGRKTKVTNPDGFATTWTYNNLGTVGNQHVLTTSQASATVTLSSWTYFDGLGRSIKKKSTGPDSQIVVSDTQYNVRGSVRQTSLPYFETGGTPSWRTMIYDPMSRVVQVTNPDGSRGLSCYDDWVSVSIDANNHRKRETRDAAGRVVKVEEYTGAFTTCDLAVGTPYATTTYQYDVLGNLRFVTDAKGNQSEMRYDTLSRKIFMHDPDMGNWTYAYDAAGNLIQQTDAKAQTITFQYDALNRRTQKALPSQGGTTQIITTSAGGGTGGDGGPATQAAVSTPYDVAVGPDGSLYIASLNGFRIRKVSPSGTITTVAGSGAMGFSGDGGPATAAALAGAFAVSVAPDGTFYIGDTNNQRIRRVAPTGIITTFAGTGTSGFSGDGGPAAAAQLANPHAVAVAPDGTVYIADASNRRVRKVSPTGTITTVAGNGAALCGADGGQATATSLYGPTGVAVGPDGRLYIVDQECNRVRRVGADGVITTVAGSGVYGFSGDGGPATAAAFRSPVRVTVTADGTLYIVDQGNHLIRRVGPDGIITTVAGTGTDGYSGDGGVATSAQLNVPLGVVFGADNNLYIADMANDRVRQVTPQTGVASTVLYTYDGTTNYRQGRLQQVQDTSGTAAFFYDVMGRIVRTDKTVSGVTYTTQSTYDGLGRVTALTYPDNSVVTNSFNGPLLQAVAEGSLTYIQYAGYNALGQPGTATFGNGVVTTYTYANSSNGTCPQ